MKITIVLVAFLISFSSAFAGEDAFCMAKAKEWQALLHEKILDDIGVIQGYYEDTTHQVTTVRHDIDNLTEIVQFYVQAENDEGDTWTWGYKVVLEVWLDAGGKPWICQVLNAEYQGVVE